MESIEQIFKSVSILPTSIESGHWIKVRRIAFGITISMVSLIVLISSIIFFCKYVNVDLESSLYAIQQISAFSYTIYTQVVGYSQRHHIEKLFIEFKRIRNKYPSELIDAANRRGELLTTLFSKVVLIGWCIGNLALAGCGYVFCLIKFGEVDVAGLYNGWRLVWPWNQQTTIGWIVNTVMVIVGGNFYLLISGAFLSLFMTACEYHCAFYKYYVEMLTATNGKIHLLQNSIRFHIDTKRLLLQTTNAFSPFILIQLISSMIFLSDSMFQMDLAFEHMNLVFFTMIWAVLFNGSYLFLYCYFGHTATDCYLAIADRAYEFNWYNQSLNLQKYFLVIIQNAQQPIYYHGFGMAYLTLTTYCGILKTVVSYYMMFKTITSVP